MTSSKREDNKQQASAPRQQQIKLDAYSRHPLRGPLYPGQGAVVNSAGAFVPIDPKLGVSPAYRNARLNHYSPFINVHSTRVDGRLPPRRPRIPLNNNNNNNIRNNSDLLDDNLRVPNSGSSRWRSGRDNIWGANSHTFSQAASRVLIVNPMHIVNLSEHTKSRLIRIIEALKRFSEKWFSHVLLLLFLAIYACFGAYIFINFEAPNEHHEKQLIISMRMKIVNDSWNARDRLKPAYFELLRMRFEEYEQLLNKACAMGFSSTSLENQWTFWGALFYSMTVFTTIGYGHLTPVTFAGRIATMIYAIFGIPILLMVLADLGKLLTRVIKYGFNKLRLTFWRLFRRKGAQRTRKMISDNTNQYIGVAKDAFERGVAYMPYVPQALRSNSIKSMSSKQQPIVAQGNDSEKNQTTSVIITSSAPTKAVSPDITGASAAPKNQLATSTVSKKRRNSGKMLSQNSIRQKPSKVALDGNSSAPDSSTTTDTISNGNSNRKTNTTIDIVDDELTNTHLGYLESVTSLPDAVAFEDIDDEFDLPVSVALALLVMYMMFGAIIFSAWEGWNFFDSLYFVFISMSTIGFGDLVPQHPKRMLATFIYLLFGLALTSMCINVVQEKIHATFLRAKMQIGEKMGLDLEQIMADDYYDEDENFNEDDNNGNDNNADGNVKNNDNNDTINKNKGPIVATTSVASSTNVEAPILGQSSAGNNNSSVQTRGRKRSTSIKEDKRKMPPLSVEQQNDGVRPPSQKNSKKEETLNDDNNLMCSKSSPSPSPNPSATLAPKSKLRTSQSQPLTSSNKGNDTTKMPSKFNNKLSADNDDSNEDKLKRPVKKRKQPILEVPVIKQLSEPMPPPRSYRWESEKYS